MDVQHSSNAVADTLVMLLFSTIGREKKNRALEERLIAHTIHGAENEQVTSQARAIVEGVVSDISQGTGK
jgi:hypothetical protein